MTTDPPSDAAAVRLMTPGERRAEEIAGHLDVPVTVAGILLVLIVIADRSTPAGTTLSTVWTVASWILWGLFVVEFVLRAVIAPSLGQFLRRNWWQLLFLAMPFLRFLRGLSRSARLMRGMTTSARVSRTAARNLTGRIGLLTSLTFGVVLAGTEILYEFGSTEAYVTALHDVALAAISGEPLTDQSAVAAWLEVVLALYATVVFAALAGSLGAFYLQRQSEQSHGAAGAPPARPSVDQ